MIINNATLQALYINLKGEFQKAYQEAPSTFKPLVTQVPSSSASNVYGWLSQLSSLREWIGDKQLKNFESNNYTLLNKDFEDTFVIDRNTLEDDNGAGVGQFGPRAAMMGAAAAAHPDQQVYAAVNAGDSTVCYDGQFMFDTDHPLQDGTTWSNFTSGAGAPWYLLDLSKPIKPFIWQVRKPYTFVDMVSPQDEMVFSSRRYRYGIEARCVAGYGLPHFAHRSEAALTEANLGAAMESMMAVKGQAGRPLGVMPNTLLVPTSLALDAMKLIDQERNASGESNIFYKRYNVIVSPFLDLT
jgi:phage major head subunit gpT-like protein